MVNTIPSSLDKTAKITLDTPKAVPIVNAIPQNIPNFIENAKGVIQHHASHIAHHVVDTGKKIIENAKSNPKAYLAGAGIATLITGVAIGRISKPSNIENENTEIIHVKLKID